MEICNIKVEKWESMLSDEREKQYFKDLDIYIWRIFRNFPTKT